MSRHTRIYNYTNMNDDTRNIVTDPIQYPPIRFTAKWVDNDRDHCNSFFNEAYNNDPMGRSHIRVYDIENHGWRTLKTWMINEEYPGIENRRKTRSEMLDSFREELNNPLIHKLLEENQRILKELYIAHTQKFQKYIDTLLEKFSDLEEELEKS